MKKKISFILGSLLFCFIFQVLRAGDIPHLVGGTVRLEDGSMIEAIQFNAHVFSRPDEILTEESSGCQYENGYYWIQCGSFATNWDAGDLLIIEIFDESGHSQEKSVTLSYSSLDTLNFVLPFTRYDYTFRTIPSGLTCWIDGIQHVTPKTFSWLENSEHSISIVSPQLEKEQSRYVFDSWSHGKTQDHTVKATSHSILIATFVPEYRLSTSVEPTIGGTVAVDPVKSWYTTSDIVQIQAFPNELDGYLFDGWTGDTISTSNPITFRMDTSRSIVANFEIRGILVDIDASPFKGGFIMVEPYKESYSYGDTVTIQAVANEAQGYFFQEWTGDISGYENPFQKILYEDLHATAVFLTQRYDLDINVEPFLSGAIDLIPFNTNYAYGDTVIIIAIPMDGYKFFFWEGDHFSLENPDTLVITGNMEITANFRVDTNVDEKGKSCPTEFKLNRNYPNPFNLSTKISIEIPKECDVKLAIYNALGKKVAVLIDGTMSSGYYDIVWNGLDTHGHVMESGVYILQCKANKYVHQIKMMLLK